VRGFEYAPYGDTKAKEEIFRGEGGGPTEKIAKKDRKIALLSFFQEGGETEKRPKKAKKSTIKPLFTISVPNMKIQIGAMAPCRRPCWYTRTSSSYKMKSFSLPLRGINTRRKLEYQSISCF